MTPARLLAPAALVAAAVALFVVLASGGGSTESSPTAAPTATPATKQAKRRPTATPTAKTTGGGSYTVKPGDTPSGIAAKVGVDVDDLLAANPDIDPSALTVGSELNLP